MATKKDDYYLAKVKKPITVDRGVVGFTDTAIRFGSLTFGGVSWEYEIPYSEIAALEYQAVRGNVNGNLKDGSELLFRIQSQMNPAKGLRATRAMEAVLSMVQPDGSSVKRISEGTATSGTGCALPGLLVLSLIFSIVLALTL